MHQLAVPRFACHQKGVGSFVVGSTVHGRENMIGLLAAAGSPDAKDGIAQYPVGGQLARRGSVSFGMVRRRDDHFGQGLTVSRGPEIGERLPAHPAAPAVPPDTSHGPAIDIDDPRLATKVLLS